MKPSELRIGNWVYAPFLKKERIIDCLDIRDQFEGRLFKPFEPIPLTSEWLERFGCIKRGTSWWETPNGIQFNFSEDNHCGLITFGSRHVNFWYVHTLQNIIALTGEELTIKE